MDRQRAFTGSSVISTMSRSAQHCCGMVVSWDERGPTENVGDMVDICLKYGIQPMKYQ